MVKTAKLFPVSSKPYETSLNQENLPNVNIILVLTRGCIIFLAPKNRHPHNLMKMMQEYLLRTAWEKRLSNQANKVREVIVFQRFGVGDNASSNT